jgi:hypothetical protein
MRTPIIVIALLIASCSAQTPPSSQPAAKAEAPSDAGYKKLDLTYRKPAMVGTEVHASSADLPAGKSVELQWGTVKGGWVIEDYYHFKGKKYTETTSSLGKFDVDAGGRLEAVFTIPEDYGGVHEITALIDGKPVAQGGIELTQSFEMTPTSGPVGTPIELKVKGLGWRTMESTWVVNWDNNADGFVSAVGTNGSAVARFRSAGPPGDHPVKVYSGYQAQSYLNYEQAPNAYLPRPDFIFRTTTGPATTSAAYIEPYAPQPVPKTEVHVDGATLVLAPTQGPVGTRATLRGEGFGTARSLQLIWQTFVGSRVSGNGFEPQEKVIGEVKVGGDGKIESPVTIPDDLGGLHGLVLREGEKTIALTHFVIETSIVSMTPASGPVGTPITIHLKGVGWTEYDNIYVATYDNAYMGYVCGFNSHGDVVINFTAAGAPGQHLIDLFPGIYQGPSTEPQLLYRQPQLTYADDHPGNKIPAIHFVFEVTAANRRPAITELN